MKTTFSLKNTFVWFVPFMGVILFASCEVSASPSTPDSALLLAPYADGNTNANLGVDDFFPSLESDLSGLDVSTDPRVTAFFLSLNPDLGVTAATLQNALVFSKLGNTKETGADVDTSTAPAVYAENGNITFTVRRISTGLARITLTNLAGENAVNSNPIELRIKAGALKGTGGLGIDSNGNHIAGEDADDIYRLITVTGGTSTDGNAVNARKPFADISFTPSALSLSVSTTTITGSAAWNASLNNEDADYLNSLAQKHLKLQKLSNSAWTEVPVTWKTTDATPRVSSFTISGTFAEWDVYRMAAVNPNELVTAKKYYGFVQKPGYNPSRTVVLYGPTVIAKANVISGSVSSPSVFFDSMGKNGLIRLQFSGIGTGGLDSATVSAANFRLYAASSSSGSLVYPVRGIPIQSARLASDTEAGNADKTTVFIFLDPAYTEGTFSTRFPTASYLQIWAGPGLKTAEDTPRIFGDGSNYLNGTAPHFVQPSDACIEGSSL
jgi:hypothetical protein